MKIFDLKLIPVVLVFTREYYLKDKNIPVEFMSWNEIEKINKGEREK